MSHTLLFVGGGLEAKPAIELAKQMGIWTVVSDAVENAPGMIIADDRLVASTYDVDATVKVAQEYDSTIRKIDGAICVASDIPLTVASVAQALGLPGISIESANLASNKLMMKERFKRDGVPIPWFKQVQSAEELIDVVNKSEGPVVLKPVDSRGSRGVFIIKNTEGIKKLFDEAMSFSPSATVMVETFLPGPQVSSESIVLDGQVFTPGFSDRNYELLEKYAPSIIENGGQLPTILPSETVSQVHKVIADAAHSLGIKNGVVKGDIVVSEGKVYVIEVAARLSGGYFCTHEIPLNTGVDFVGAAIKLALGMPVDSEDLVPKYQKAVAQRYFFPTPGVVKSIDNVDMYDCNSDVVLLEVRVKVGDIVADINNHPGRAGVVITIGDDRASAVKLAEEVISKIQINTE